MKVRLLATRRVIPYGLHFDLEETELRVDLFKREVELIEWQTESEEGTVSRSPRGEVKTTMRVRLGYPYREKLSLGDLIRLLWVLWKKPKEFLFYQMLGRAFGASISRVVRLMLGERGRGSVISA